MNRTAMILVSVASLGMAAATVPARAADVYVDDGPPYGVAYGPGYYGPLGYGSYAYYGGPNYYGPRFAFLRYRYRTIHR